MRIEEFRAVVAELHPRQPLTDAFECMPDTSHTRYDSQRTHLLRWLGEYREPGAYGRKHPGQDAKFFYNHFRCSPGLLWLAEALGEESARLRKAMEAVRQAPANPSSQCAAFRRVIPWARIEELIREHENDRRQRRQRIYIRLQSLLRRH